MLIFYDKDNGKELLSMNEVLNYLLRVSRPLVDPADLKKYSMFTQREWQNFVDQVRGMLVTLPGKVNKYSTYLVLL